MRNLAAAKGDWNPENLARLLENARRDAIKVAPKPLSSTNAGFATTRVDTGPWKMRVVIHDQLDERASFAVLCHELAHIYLGHLGGDKKARWPSRLNLTHAAVELEAESAAYITCTRLGITPSSERYLSGYLKNDKVISLVSIEMIVKVAGKLEGMARHQQPDRQAKPAPPPRTASPAPPRATTSPRTQRHCLKQRVALRVKSRTPADPGLLPLASSSRPPAQHAAKPPAWP